MKTYLKLRGVRGSTPTPYKNFLKTGGNTPCIEIIHNKERTICDAGTGIVQLGNEILQDPNCFNLNLFMTHYHWDHIQGLPFFIPAFIPQYQIDIHGPGRSSEKIKEIISKQMQPPYFPVETETWLADIHYHMAKEMTTKAGLKVIPFAVHHPGATFGYRFEVNNKTAVFIPDNELLFITANAKKKLKEARNKQEVQWMESIMLEEQEKSIQHFRGVDYLIHDAQYTPEDYKSKRGWGHSCFVDTVKVAIKAEVKHLYLYHMDPSYDDEKVDQLECNAQQIIKQAGSSMICEIARETTIINLSKENENN